MNIEGIEVLMQQALYENAIDIECPKCNTDLRIEPDADEAWCSCCNEVVKGVNPLIKAGLI